MASLKGHFLAFELTFPDFELFSEITLYRRKRLGLTSSPVTTDEISLSHIF